MTFIEKLDELIAEDSKDTQRLEIASRLLAGCSLSFNDSTTSKLIDLALSTADMLIAREKETRINAKKTR